MLHRLSLWLDELSHSPYLSSDPLGQDLPEVSGNISTKSRRMISKSLKWYHQSPYSNNLAAQPDSILQGNYIFSHFYNITLGMIKLSILTFYYRVFITPLFRKVVLASITFIALWVLTITIVLALDCRPIAKFWNPVIPGKCFNLVAFSYFTNISNLVTDLWFFFLPIPVFLRLHISLNQKL